MAASSLLYVYSAYLFTYTLTAFGIIVCPLSSVTRKKKYRARNEVDVPAVAVVYGVVEVLAAYSANVVVKVAEVPLPGIAAVLYSGVVTSTLL